MKHSMFSFGLGALCGGSAVYFRCRILGAIKVLVGKAEAIAIDKALAKIEAAAEAVKSEIKQS